MLEGYNSRHHGVEFVPLWVVDKVGKSVVVVEGVRLLSIAIVMFAPKQMADLMGQGKPCDGNVPLHNGHHL